MDDAVGSVAVGLDAFQVAAQLTENIIQQFPLFFVQGTVFAFFNGLLHLLQQLFGNFGEVLDEVQRVPDFMGHAGGEFAQRGQLFPHHDLALGHVQVAEGLLQFIVFALQLLGQLLNQVEPLHFQGVTTEDLQGSGHVGHFVPSGNLGPGFQVSAGHALHPVGQHGQAPQQDTPDEEPGDEHRAGDADRGDRQQQGSPGENRLTGCFGGCLGAGLRRAHQAVHRADQAGRDGMVVGQVFLLALVQLQFASAQIEPIPRSHSQLFQAVEHRHQLGVQGRIPQIVKVPLDMTGRGLEALPHRLNQGRFGHGGRAGEQLNGYGGVFLQLGQVTEVRQLVGCQMFLRRGRGRSQLEVSGAGVEKMVIDCGDDDVIQTEAQIRQLQSQIRRLINQAELLRHAVLNCADIRYQTVGIVANLFEAFCVAAALGQQGQLFSE